MSSAPGMRKLVKPDIIDVVSPMLSPLGVATSMAPPPIAATPIAPCSALNIRRSFGASADGAWGTV